MNAYGYTHARTHTIETPKAIKHVHKSLHTRERVRGSGGGGGGGDIGETGPLPAACSLVLAAL